MIGRGRKYVRREKRTQYSNGNFKYGYDNVCIKFHTLYYSPHCFLEFCAIAYHCDGRKTINESEGVVSKDVIHVSSITFASTSSFTRYRL
mmetsp:Transcript_16789/g.47349  ORF Transcript_16789/g.47349 Transcript_16789/m.47349 type:complete len:90 (-) Transcript_16789:372-641(-)